jgi:phospholipid/cholesterol/gamma-HCH transport system substrate-binding protein
MTGERKGPEVLVGLFLFVGLAVIAGMILLFGSKGQQMGRGYDISVELPNADGLIRNSLVMLAGAPIGQVATPPALIGKSFHVLVKLRIREDVRIPRQASFLVSSSGLMGDKFVNVVVPEKADLDDMIAPGERLVGGAQAVGFEELANKGGIVMDQLNSEIKQIETMTQTLNEKLLSDANMKNLQDTFANLKTTTESLKATSDEFRTVIEKAGTAVDSAKSVMKTADGAATDLRGAIGEARKTADAATKTIEVAQGLLHRAAAGDGTLGALISDRKMADDLKALVANLRHSGIVFYRDRPVSPEPASPRH